MATNPTSNTANTTVSDRTSSGIKPDGTPAVGTVASGSSSGVTSVSSGSSNVTVTSTGGGGTGDVTISVSGGSGTGNVTGTGTTTVGHVAVFNNTSATGIQDGGPASLTIASNAVSLGGSVSQDSITGLAPTTAGIVKHTSTANTLGIAVAADFPTLNQNTTGNAATVTGLSVTSGKTLTANNTLTLSGTDGSTLNIGTGGTLGSAAYTASSAYVAASSGTATNLTLAGTLKDSNSSSAGTSGQVLSSLGTGTKWVTPSSGGNVTGTSPTVSGNVAVFNNTTGTGIQDGGTLGTAAFTASTAYVSATTTQTAHKFLAGPLSGTAAPTFRVIDPTDVPTLNQSTTGNAATATTATTATTAGNVTGIVAVANGGTGTSGPSLINGTGISVTGSWPNQTITNTTSGVPSGGTQGQRLIKDYTNTVAWGNDPMIYAEDYGLSTSNSASVNTTALQNAVNAAVTANGCLLIPAGQFHINNTITIGTSGTPLNGVVRIQGCGKLVTEIVQDGAYNGFTTYLANPNGENIGIEFEDLSVIGNNTGCGTAIYVNIVQYGSIENRDLVCINNVSVTGVITNNTGGWINGFWIIGGWHILITNSYAGGYLTGGNPPSSGLGSGAGFLIQDCVNVKLDTITAEWWGKGISLIQPNFTTQGVQINNLQTLQTTNAIYNNGSTMYVTNFLLDNGNISNSNWVTVNVVNHFGGGYMVGGQVLQNGGANQISISGNYGSGQPSGLMLSNIDFTQQNALTGASILITNSSKNNLITSCYFGGAIAVQCDNGCLGNRAYSNIAPNGCLDSNVSSPFNYLGDDIGYTNVYTLTGGTTTESHILYVSPSGLGRKPDGVSAQVTSDPTVGCYYNWDDVSNSSTQVAIVFFKYSGGNLSSGPVRITARVGP